MHLVNIMNITVRQGSEEIVTSSRYVILGRRRGLHNFFLRPMLSFFYCYLYTYYLGLRYDTKFLLFQQITLNGITFTKHYNFRGIY